MTKTDTFRRKLLRIMPRAWLEDQLGNEARPWQMTRTELEARLFTTGSAEFWKDLLFEIQRKASVAP